MRRVALVALVFLAFAPAARAGCGVVTSTLAGKAPLTVTLTATCASAAYTWDLGDGQTASGQTVQHQYPAGYWRPKLASDAGEDLVQPVTSRFPATKKRRWSALASSPNNSKARSSR